MQGGSRLDGTRLLVVGASAGIGRAFAAHALAAGASVAVVARRRDELEKLCAEGGRGTVVVADVSDAEDCRRLVDEAVAAMGGIDLVFQSAGAGEMSRLAEPDAVAWRRAFDVNVIGPVLVTAAALPHLSTDGLVAYLSSNSTDQTRWGLSSYTASKAALDASIRSWRLEHPDRRFLRVHLGATMPTDFGTGFDGPLLTEGMQRWADGGIPTTALDTDAVAAQLVDVLGALLAHRSVDVGDVSLNARGEPLT
jgi:NAD(P)-dependent dehydrogenase (short-subunit alcohol dehydrogenase family)